MTKITMIWKDTHEKEFAEVKEEYTFAIHYSHNGILKTLNTQDIDTVFSFIKNLEIRDIREIEILNADKEVVSYFPATHRIGIWVVDGDGNDIYLENRDNYEYALETKENIISIERTEWQAIEKARKIGLWKKSGTRITVTDKRTYQTKGYIFPEDQPQI